MYPETPKTHYLAASTALNAESTRKAFLAQAAGIAFAGILPGVANAAKYGDFGAGSPGVLDPKSADVDTEILGSAAVQSSLKKIQSYRDSVKTMQAALASDPQSNIRPYILKELDYANIRDSMNVLNTAFDEDTQRGTDRLIRVILQDITELEVANNQKEGIPRSPRRLEIMNGKLAKLETAFNDFLAFAK